MKNVRNIPLLLTATVNPQGMANASFSVEERERQYVEAIRFYLKALPQAVLVFAENSGCLPAVSRHFGVDEPIEWIDASLLDAPFAYDQKRGKGYNEWLLMHQAIVHSSAIQAAGCFFKVTGRLKVRNIASLINECQKRDPEMRFLADCKDHEVYRWLHIQVSAHSGECRYFFSTTAFFLTEVFTGYERLSDEEYLAEDLMLEVCRRARQLPHCYDRFKTQARISGKGGHSLGEGSSFFHSTDNDSAVLRFKCMLRQLIRWLIPWWRA